jgi:hypothetical protein
MVNKILMLLLFSMLWSCQDQKPQVQPKVPQTEDNRVTKVAEPAFEGFFVRSDTLNIFYECSSGKYFLVRCDDEMKNYLATRYQEVSSSPEEEVYVQFRGKKAMEEIATGDRKFDGLLAVKSVIAFRQKTDKDCSEAQQ